MSSAPRPSPQLPEALRQLAADPRVTILRPGPPFPDARCVVYCMERAQRGRDNHALDLAVHAANALDLPLVVCFAGIATLPRPSLRHASFLHQGLPDIEADLAARNIAFLLYTGSPAPLLHSLRAALCVADEDHLREPARRRRSLAAQIDIPLWTVDANVIVPTRLIENAQYGAYTIRPRLRRLLPEYLVPYENPTAHRAWRRPRGLPAHPPRSMSLAAHARLNPGLDTTILPVEAWHGGPHGALRRLHHFIQNILPTYERARSRPELDGTSALSPYLHFGHIGPLTVALAVNAAADSTPALAPARDAFFNELIVWRELAVNFVRHTPRYDTPACAEPWAKKTIAAHARDQREHLYSLTQLEAARTHDDLWNAAQTQLLRHGWMHNVMRMYWAKKILEWTPTIATAVRYAIHLNDTYLLDGSDPNGYAGIAWAMLGKFDRAWADRPIFGKLRYMSGTSTGRKFDSKRYIAQMDALPTVRKGLR
jgi:deoxyribodipyrimidine photo-lyase